MARERPKMGSAAEIQRLKDSYEHYLLDERGLSPATCHTYWYYVNAVLCKLVRGGSIDLAKLGPATIEKHMSSVARRVSTCSVQITAAALRSFLSFLFRSRRLKRNLAPAVPSARSWARATLPRYLPMPEVELLIRSCDRTTTIGRRDRALLLLMARLGLRAREVSGLTLDDLSWETGTVLVRGKGGLHDHLPLPRDVGEALAAYLRTRGRQASRRLFMPTRAPLVDYASSEFVHRTVERAAIRAGIKLPARHVGTHVLRHSLATGMLRRGASLQEVGAVLRHRRADTTTIYAKVDIENLRRIARPWPLEVRP